MSKCLYFLLFSFSLFSQNKPLAVTINSIVTDNFDKYQRKFTVDYQIENLTNETISFYLDTKNIKPNAVASMALCPNYKIFENENYINIDGVFERYIDDIDPKTNTVKKDSDALIKKSMDYFKKYKDSIVAIYKKNNGTSDDDFWILKNHNLLETLKTIAPKQTLKIKNDFFWQRNRYFKNFDSEFYLDEKNNYFLQIGLVLLKDEFQDRLTKSEFNTIKNNKNFINGVFESNKMKIDFGE